MIYSIIPAFLVVKYGRYIKDNYRKVFYLLLIAFMFYGSAIYVSNIGRNIHGDRIEGIGSAIHNFTIRFGDEDIENEYTRTEALSASPQSIEWRIMELVVEESLEYLGSIFLLATSVAFLEEINP